MQKNFWIFTVILLAAVLCNSPAEGKHNRLRELSAREVYSILRDAGREDVIPAGRFITHGIEEENEPEAENEPEPEVDLTETGRVLVSTDALNATATLLDYMKHLNYTALLTAFIPTYNFTITRPTFNLTALNLTSFYTVKPRFNLTNLTYLKSGFNLTALTAVKPAFNVTALTKVNPGLNLTTLSLGLITTRAVPKTVQSEICFASRSLNEINDEEIESETEPGADSRQITDIYTETMPTYETALSPTSPQEDELVSSPDVSSSPDSPTPVSSTGSGVGILSGTDSRFGTETGLARNPRPYKNQRLGRPVINCVVVRRPQTTPQNVRRRQSAQRQQNVRRPPSTRRPQNVRRPKPVRRVHNVRRPQNIQRPQYVRRLQNVRRPQNARRPQNIGRGRNAGN